MKVKMYEKPEVKVIEISDNDIIQTSNQNLTSEDLVVTTPGGNGIQFMSNAVQSDALFKN